MGDDYDSDLDALEVLLSLSGGLNDRLQEVLDEMVHNEASMEASAVNNSGAREQMRYLLAHGTPLPDLTKVLQTRTSPLTGDE